MKATLIIAVLALLPLACAQGNDGCDSLLRIRNQLEQPGIVLKPARLSLQHSAGGETLGRVDMAALHSIACSTGDGDWNLDAGIDYHRNTDSSVEKHTAAAGVAFNYGWTTAEAGTAGNWHNVLASASYGRNILDDTSIRRARIAYSAAELSGGERPSAFGLLGGDGLRRTPDGTPDGKISTLFSYGITPAIDYFDGYRVAADSRNRHATLASLDIAAEWYPFAPFETGSVRLGAEWSGRHRLAGDSDIPKNSGLGTISVDFEFLQRGSATAKQGAALSLQYQKGRVPENGFAKDETIELVLTYVLDRR